MILSAQKMADSEKKQTPLLFSFAPSKKKKTSAIAIMIWTFAEMRNAFL